MGWWILTALVIVAVLASWVLVHRWSDLGQRADDAGHDSDRAAALREARRQGDQGRGWSGFGGGGF